MGRVRIDPDVDMNSGRDGEGWVEVKKGEEAVGEEEEDEEDEEEEEEEEDKEEEEEEDAGRDEAKEYV